MNSLLVSSCRNLLPDIAGSIANCGFAARLTIPWREWREGLVRLKGTLFTAPRGRQQAKPRPENVKGAPQTWPGKAPGGEHAGPTESWSDAKQSHRAPPALS